MLGRVRAQVRTCFAEKTLLCGKVSWLNAHVRTSPRRICRGNRDPPGFWLMLGFVQLRAGFAENTVRAGSWANA